MEVVTLVLVMLLMVVGSGFAVRILRWKLPLPLVQIALGAGIAAVTDIHINLNPAIFFLLFLPPLLFLDGWRIPKIGLFRDKGTIIELALGLVLFTVLGMGFLIHWMIPAMPMPVAFALAAVLSPTDPVAVSAIASRTPIPGRVMHILEGESLLNDASGLVCLRFAVAAAMTGSFVLTSAMGTFLWLVVGGVGAGVAVTLGSSAVKGWFARRYGEETGTQILISLLIPFGAYLAAEHIHASGILAAVSAGITMGYVETTGKVLAATRVGRNAVWDAVQFAANGVIFVLLGQQLPALTEGAARIVRETGHLHPSWLILYVLGITLALGVLRFLWVWISMHLTMLRGRRIGFGMRVRLVSVISVAGVRGAVTLAGILTLPLVLSDGTPLHTRDLAIFLAAWVIITTLVVASAVLPRLAAGLEVPAEPARELEEDRARALAGQAALAAIEQAQAKAVSASAPASGSHADEVAAYVEACARILSFYRRRVDGATAKDLDRETILRAEAAEKELRLVAIRAERDEIFRLARARMLEDDVMRRLVRELDLMEARYTTA